MNNGKSENVREVRGPRGGGPRGNGFAALKNQRPDGKTVKRLLKYLLKYKWKLGIVLVCIAVSSLTGIVASLFLKTLIDDCIMPLVADKLAGIEPVFDGLYTLIIMMAGIYVAGIISNLFHNRLMVDVSQGVLRDIRDEMFAHMQKLPIKYFDTHTYGDTMSRYTNDTDTLRQMISQSVPQIISSIITVIGVFIAMVTTNIWLTILVVVFVFGVMMITGKIASKSGTYFVEQQKCIGSMNGFIEEMISGQKVIKVFNHEPETKEEFDRRNEELCEAATNAHTFANILMPIMGNLNHVLYVLISVIGGALAISGFGGITLGIIVSFLQLSKSFAMPLNQMSQQLNSIIMALAGAKRIFDLMDEPEEVDDGYVTLVNAEEDENGELHEVGHRTGTWAWKHPHEDGTTTYTKLCGEVRFFDVDFGYTEEKTVLHDITLYAEPGQKVAFVGATGAGKTTITNLINRFYDIADGKIRYDGININKIKKNDLRRSLGIVLQDVNLFTGTVMDNIRYGKLDATDEECIAAAKLAGADWFISMMPEGYNTMIDGSGSDLSQGQRQLISIARAAVADPPVMILDEATSSIDTRTEAIVQAGMDRLMAGRTVFVIAHRLSTVRNSDVIMVLDHGHIIERGNHEKLIAERGQYYRLYTGAFELE